MAETEQLPTLNPYQILGGEAVLRGLVLRFYELMNTLPEARGIRKLHGADLEDIRHIKCFM